MRLISITSKNYRTLENIELKFAKNYCTLSGRNNAGKSCVIRLLSTLFRTKPPYLWPPDESSFDYKEDKTQWIKQAAPIQVNYLLELTKEEDPALISFIEKIASKELKRPTVSLHVSYTLSEGDSVTVGAVIDEEVTDEKAAKEIEKRIKDSNLLFLYNSTTPHEDYYFGRGRRRTFYEFVMSKEEKKELEEAGKRTERRLKRLAKEHTQGLSTMLGRLNEQYDVELSPPEAYTARQMPLGINLKDRNVEVPLIDWGSGTQNRTHILMAILQANRIKTTASSDDKITPFVVIEEPESFLHPSAQSEFGRLLGVLSAEFGIQIIVTTHSPYMLNQAEPTSNILLSREIKRKTAYQTIVIDTAGDNWMAPFSDHLGLAAAEFSSLRAVFSSYKSKVLLVEGAIDQEYFCYLQKHQHSCECLADDVEIVPYGGKDTLKNTLLIQFVLRKFDKVFITYDLDADNEIRGALARLGLNENIDFLPLGLSQAGKDCIEGLLPECVLGAVNGRETDLVMKLGSKNSTERRKAKDALKRKYLDQFTSCSEYEKDELKGLAKVVKTINAKLAIH
ncbi:MAG TPA: AAA family ATPase [Terriglobales bacterium]|nr:AAA family ATPase [Terriglobales bacterium]